MKTILIKIATILLSIVLAFTIFINTYMFITAYMVAKSHTFFDKVSVMYEHKIFENAWFGAFSLFFTVIILALMEMFVLDNFIFKNKKEVHYLDNRKYD